MELAEQVKNLETNHMITDLYKQLMAPFPPEAYSKDDSRGFALTSLRPQWIVERLNDVFGWNGWSLEGQFQSAGNGILYLGHLSIFNNTIAEHRVQAVGWSQNKKNLGDTYKGAKTDALSKAASYLGIGNEVFKGNIDPNTRQERNVENKKNTSQQVSKVSPKVVSDLVIAFQKNKGIGPGEISRKVGKPSEKITLKDINMLRAWYQELPNKEN